MDDVTSGCVRFIGPYLPSEYSALAKATDGHLYAVPMQKGGRVIEVNPTNGKVREIGAPLLEANNLPYIALAEEGGVLCSPPAHASKVLRIDSHCGAVHYVGPDFRTAGPVAGHYVSMAAAANGRFYAPPCAPGYVLEICPRDGHTALLGDKIEEATDFQYNDIVLASNGCLYSPPATASRVLEINPSTGTVRYIGDPILPRGGRKYRHARLAGNGKLYAAPVDAPRVLEIDPIGGKVQQIGAEDLRRCGGFSSLHTLRGDQKLWGCSTGALPQISLLEITPESGKVRVHNIADFMQGPPLCPGARYSHWAAAGNSRLYGFPYKEGAYILEIDPHLRTAREIGEPLETTYDWAPVVADNGRIFSMPACSPNSPQRILQIDYRQLPSHHSKTLSSLREALSAGDLSDVIVRTSHGKTYRAHKLILMLKSRVFRLMFAANMREANDALVELGDVPPSVSDMFMKYIYSEDTEAQRISVQELCELSELAHRYEMADLVTSCTSLLQRSISTRCASHLLRFADRLQCASLKEACLDFIIANPDVMDTDEWDEVANSQALAREVAEALTGRRCKWRRVGAWEFPANTTWEDLTVPKLRRACAERGLAQDGERQSLLERLQA
mmetsp:Transcript_18875/g.43874  ORF Transcript_18875/g.43874 Transcript_18875/m.43874 type:complete len:616 (+) Transcript_18875:57-1904(+)